MPREEPHLTSVTLDTEEPGPGPSSPQCPPEGQLAGITLLLLDPVERGPLALELHSETLARRDDLEEFEVRGQPTPQVSMDKKPGKEGATGSATGNEVPVTSSPADHSNDAAITSSPEGISEHQARGGPGASSSVWCCLQWRTPPSRRNNGLSRLSTPTSLSLPSTPGSASSSRSSLAKARSGLSFLA